MNEWYHTICPCIATTLLSIIINCHSPRSETFETIVFSGLSFFLLYNEKSKLIRLEQFLCLMKIITCCVQIFFITLLESLISSVQILGAHRKYNLVLNIQIVNFLCWSIIWKFIGVSITKVFDKMLKIIYILGKAFEN